MKSESAELTRKLQAQVAKAEELGKSHLVAEESQQRLLQARADMVSGLTVNSIKNYSITSFPASQDTGTSLIWAAESYFMLIFQ